MMYAVSALGILRVSKEGELQGLDLHEHGVPAYPEYALHPAATPQGGPAFTERALPSTASQVLSVSAPGTRRS